MTRVRVTSMKILVILVVVMMGVMVYLYHWSGIILNSIYDDLNGNNGGRIDGNIGDGKDGLKVVMVTFHNTVLLTKNATNIYSSFHTMCVILQYYYAKLHGYKYIYYISDKPYFKYDDKINQRERILNNPRFSKILIIFDAINEYCGNGYDYVIYMDTDAYVYRINISLSEWIHKQELLHPNINNYSFILLNSIPWNNHQTSIIIMPCNNYKYTLNIIQNWWYLIGVRWGNFTHDGADQDLFDENIAVEYNSSVIKLNEPQNWRWQDDQQHLYWDMNPYFIHFIAYVRRPYVNKKFKTDHIIYDSMKEINIYQKVVNLSEIISQNHSKILQHSIFQNFLYNYSYKSG